MSSPPKPRRLKPEPIETSTTSSKKVRKFAVEPVETTTRSSKESPKENEVPEAGQKPRRRFAPEPVETTTRSSKDIPLEETKTKPRRKFAVEPIETSLRSSKDGPEDEETSPKSTRSNRRFAPEPIETSTRHSGQDKEQNSSPGSESSSAAGTPKRRRFAPEKIETTTFSNRSSPMSIRTGTTGTLESMESAPLLPHEMDFLGLGSSARSRPRRKFAPQLIETARRSRRSGSSLPTLLESDKTDRSPELEEIRPRPARRGGEPVPPSNTPYSGGSSITSTAQRQLASQSTSRSTSSRRKHSYQVPTLDSIESSESDESPPPSLYHSNRGESPYSDTSEDNTFKHATRMRESVDERFSGYLLSLAAQAAEKQLREQAAAAYPNANIYEPVEHYVDASDDEDVTPVSRFRADPTRRDSGDEKWAIAEMRRHGEELLRQRTLDDRGYMQKDPWATPIPDMKAAKKVVGGFQADPDLKRMLEAARPPMLGDDIDFPRCASPEHARFDVTQGADFLREQMCYLTQENHTVDENGLWAKRTTDERPKLGTKNTQGTAGTWGSTPSVSRPGTSNGGLWGGLCTNSDSRVPQISGLLTPSRTPLATPRLEIDDPFAGMSFSPPPSSILSVNNLSASAPSLPNQRYPNNALGVPLTPTTSRSGQPSPQRSTFSPATKPSRNPNETDIEVRLDAEFTDSFVTQVYNYLSLGYPSLAWKFDEELSRVTHIPVSELRQDDKLAGPRGHIRLGDDEVDVLIADVGDGVEAKKDSGGVVQEDMCRRWRALRRYVREWGRQMIRVGDEGGKMDPHEAWGMPPRRGSWGI